MFQLVKEKEVFALKLKKDRTSRTCRIKDSLNRRKTGLD